MSYRCEAASVAGFLQQLAVAYLPHGYWFYVAGCIPEGKDPRAVDARILEKYGIAISRWARARRKRAGLANIHYLRFRRFFVILASHGVHHFFIEEAGRVRDARRRPITFWGYAVSFRRGHSHVRIEQEEYRWWKSSLLEKSLKLPPETLAAEFWRLPFESYAPVRRQMLGLWRSVNRRRRLAGLPTLPVTCIRLRRRICRPFGPSGAPAENG